MSAAELQVIFLAGRLSPGNRHIEHQADLVAAS